MERSLNSSFGASRTPARRSTRLNGPPATEIVNLEEIHEEEAEGPKPVDRDQPIVLPVTEASSESEEDEEATLRDIRPAFLRRSDLNEIMLLDDWTTLVQGCFVRIPVGRNEHNMSNYRVGRIHHVNVGQHTEEDGTILARYEFHVDLGDRQRLFFLRNISNSVITESEWNNYVARVKDTLGRAVSKSEILNFIEERTSRSLNLQFAPEFRHLRLFMLPRRQNATSPSAPPGSAAPSLGNAQFQGLWPLMRLTCAITSSICNQWQLMISTYAILAASLHLILGNFGRYSPHRLLNHNRLKITK